MYTYLGNVLQLHNYDFIYIKLEYTTIINLKTIKFLRKKNIAHASAYIVVPLQYSASILVACNQLFAFKPSGEFTVHWTIMKNNL